MRGVKEEVMKDNSQEKRIYPKRPLQINLSITHLQTEKLPKYWQRH